MQREELTGDAPGTRPFTQEQKMLLQSKGNASGTNQKGNLAVCARIVNMCGPASGPRAQVTWLDVQEARQHKGRW